MDTQEFMDKKNPVKVLGLIPGSPSERAGVRIGDLIFSVNGIPVGSFSDYVNAKGENKESTELVVIRNNTVLEIVIRY